MKLFAKRTKKAGKPSSTVNDNGGERTVFQSDPVCEELLQQDPSTWNAKQRRMIRRYQDRKKEAASERKGTDEETETEEVTNGTVEKSEKLDDNNDANKAEDEESEDDSSSASSSGSENSESSSDEVDEESLKETKINQSSEIVDTGETVVEKDEPPKDTSNDADDAKQSADVAAATDLDEILERLDSKNRRKLRRKVDRGEATTDDIRKEALALLESPTDKEQSKTAASENDIATAKRGAMGETSESESQKGKKRRKVDWSTLSPEERMRREEQRRIQQEVAARRAAGELPVPTKHRHPLNSERRRANRRKPKWKAGNNINKPTNDHDVSGFQVRRGKPVAF